MPTIENVTTQAQAPSLVEVTPSAAVEMKRLLSKQDNPEAGVRLGVRGGGCAGYNYDMQVDTARLDGDSVIECGGVRLIIDRKSMVFLAGLTLDFSTDLLSGGFKFSNPNATRTCGCGTSFSV